MTQPTGSDPAGGPARQELLRSAAKWLIGSLGAIGAVLVAGSQLSSIGSLTTGPRLVIAVGGLAVGLGGVLLAIALAVGVLAGEPYSVTELHREWVQSDAASGASGVRGRWRRRRYPVPFFFADNEEFLAGHESPMQLYEHSVADASDAEDAYRELNVMLGNANYRREMVRFGRSKKWIFLGVILASVGITVFAWAANPGADANASMRNADLTNADLRGANLRKADLTGANLTNTNLRGANLRDAIVTDATWHNTTCPDGTNSDAAMRPGKSPTCEGHLIP